MSDYHGGATLNDLRNQASARYDIRADAGLTWITLAGMGDRCGSSTTIDLSPDELAEFIGACRMALEANRNFNIQAGGVA